MFGGGAHAALIAEESFVYAPGSLAAQNGGTGFGGAWTGTAANVATPGSSFTNLAVAGNTAQTTTGFSSRNLSAAVGGVSGQSIFLAFLITRNSGDDEAAGVRVSTPNNFLELGRTSFGNYGVRVNFGGGAQTGAGATIGVTNLLVYEFATGATDTTLNIWANPAVGSPLPVTPDATATLTNSNGSFNNVEVGANGTANYDIDELRIGTTFADVAPVVVVPEAGTLALLSPVLMLALIAARKRRA